MAKHDGGTQGYIAVYLPDDTVIGKALVTKEGRRIEIDLREGGLFDHLIMENLVGLSVVYKSNEARDYVADIREKSNGD